MNINLTCPFCNTSLTKKKFCDGCGEDVTIYKKAVASSYAYYNKGLEKAKVRDLSGAISDLKKSLELYKYNIQARNLLGLCYYETGDIVNALSEWVLSKNLMPKKNELADYYINDIQSNPTKLENYNQAIKKYNSALASVMQDGEDLAIIQLKKVINLNPRFIKAMHLLALLYIKNGERERAHRILLKAIKIDVNNTTTMRYLAELGYKSDGPDTGSLSYASSDAAGGNFSASDFYRDDKPNVMAFVNLIIGVVVGLALAFFLIVPAVKKDAAKEYSINSTDYNDQLAKKDSDISTLQTTNKTLQDKIDKLTSEVENLSQDTTTATGIDTVYGNLFKAIQYYQKGEKESAVAALSKVKAEKLENAEAKAIYTAIKSEIYDEVVNSLYDKGHNQYTSGNYEEALTTLKKAYSYDSKNVDVIYFMARSFDKTGNKEKAKKYYQHIIDNYPDNNRASEAKSKLKEIS